MYDILLFESDLGTLDTSNLGLVFFLFCGTTMYYFWKDVWRMLSKKDKVSTALGNRCSLCIWKIHCSKKNSYILFENWIWGHANILTVEGQKDNFWQLKVREISILLFVKFLTTFVNLSPKSDTIRMRGGHVVWNCSPCCHKTLQGFQTSRSSIYVGANPLQGLEGYQENFEQIPFSTGNRCNSVSSVIIDMIIFNFI